MNSNLLIVAVFLVGSLLLLRDQLDTLSAGSGGGEIGTDTPDEESAGILSDLVTSAAAAVGLSGAGATLSAYGLDKIKEREGFSATAYPDHKGYSIGYGHLIRPGDGLTPNSVISRQDALDLLAGDVAWAVAAVNRGLSAGIGQNAFDALCSFTFNVGAGAFAKSTLLRRINAGDRKAADEFRRWIYASGQQNSALIARRANERTQFLTDYA